MVDVKIRRKGNGGNAALLGIVIMAVLLLARWGSRLGDIHDKFDREREEAERSAKILEGKDLQGVGEVLRNGDSVKRALDALQKNARKAQDHEPPSN